MTTRKAPSEARRAGGRVAAFGAAAMLAAALSACGWSAGRVFEPELISPSGETTALEPWLDALAARDADVLFLGERHDSALHHDLQARITEGLERRGGAAGGVAALVFEMIPAAREADALEARGWPAPSAAEESRAVGAAVAWRQNGWPDFALYSPILEAAPRAYVAGAGYPRSELMRAARDAAWLAREPGAARFGLAEALPPGQQAAREAAQIASHCNAIPAEVAPMMVDAQRARDARLAEAVLRARSAAAEAGLNGLVVVITGRAHARRDYGAPALLARAAPELDIVAVGMIETAPGFTVDPDDAALFDAWAPTPFPAEPRADPCEAFLQKRGAKG